MPLEHLERVMAMLPHDGDGPVRPDDDNVAEQRAELGNRDRQLVDQLRGLHWHPRRWGWLGWACSLATFLLVSMWAYQLDVVGAGTVRLVREHPPGALCYIELGALALGCFRDFEVPAAAGAVLSPLLLLLATAYVIGVLAES